MSSTRKFKYKSFLIKKGGNKCIMNKINLAILAMIVLITLVSGVFLVSAVPSDKDSIDKITFIHYKDGKVKVVDPKARPGTNTCYKLMGVKWAGTNPAVSYVINPTNQQGLPQSFVTSAISISAETWDSATSKELFNNKYQTDTLAQYGVQDYKNAIAFGDYPQDGVIAVTLVWYNRFTKNIVEFDMELDTDFEWGDAAVDPSKMDLQNIATHELGHSVGLSDLYNSCTPETMYGYSTEGETKKRDLNSGDIAGLRKIYGI